MIYLPEDILPHSNISSPPCALHVQPFKRLLSFQDILPCSNFRSCFLNKNFLILYLSPVISCLLCSFVHNYNMSPGVSVRTQISCPHCQIRVLATVNPCFLFNQIWHFLILSGLHHLEGDIGGYPIPQYRTKKQQIPKYRVANRLNTDTAYFNYIYNRFRILMVASIYRV